MIEILIKIDKLISDIEKAVVGVLLVAMVVLIFVNISMRSMIDVTITWAEDLAIYMMVSMAFFAGAYGTRLWSHISMNAIYDFMPFKVRKVVYGFILVLGCWFSIMLVVWCWQVTVTIRSMNAVVASMDMPKHWPYALIQVALVFMAIHFLQLLYRFARTGETDGVLESPDDHFNEE